jgi:hypothetical protein
MGDDRNPSLADARQKLADEERAKAAEGDAPLTTGDPGVVGKRSQVTSGPSPQVTNSA